MQHIIFSMNDSGKAAIVVPTGFLTVKNGIGKTIREYLIDEEMVRGVVSMPSNIFATTGTNVSVLFIDKESKGKDVILIDASGMGTKIKVDGKNQRTVLSEEEMQTIVDMFNKKEVVDKVSAVASFSDIKKKKYSLSVAMYFEAKLDYSELSMEEFEEEVRNIRENLNTLFEEEKGLNKELIDKIGGLSYGS